MQSSTEPTPTDRSTTSHRTWVSRLERWNRRLHFYLGLYLLLFVWLFALTGLLLNHSQWKFAEFWANRQETSEEHSIVAPPAGSDLTRARHLMRQLGLRGEIDWTAGPSDGSRMQFRVSRPGQIIEINADLTQNQAALKHIDLNGWGVARILHTFTGVRPDDARNRRDWVLASIWAWTMDAVAAGLVLMVLSSLYLWWARPQKRRSGLVVLLLGCVVCGLFCVGLRWLY